MRIIWRGRKRMLQPKKGIRVKGNEKKLYERRRKEGYIYYKCIRKNR